MAIEVIIEEYNPGWIDAFNQEQIMLRSALRNESIVFEHIGSTSVIGLPSKPILDIAIGVNDLVKADAFIEPLARLGYEYVPKREFPIDDSFERGHGDKARIIYMFIALTVKNGATTFSFEII